MRPLPCLLESSESSCVPGISEEDPVQPPQEGSVQLGSIGASESRRPGCATLSLPPDLLFIVHYSLFTPQTSIRHLFCARSPQLSRRSLYIRYKRKPNLCWERNLSQVQ